MLIDFFQKFYNRTIEISKIDSIDEVNEAILMILLIARTVDNGDTCTYKSLHSLQSKCTCELFGHPLGLNMTITKMMCIHSLPYFLSHQVYSGNILALVGLQLMYE